jgi:nitroimidazol reductase NimA-like FMN-containing flavoprotein (pyridoxamine 5'-phosphate oxidase superfamily)
MMATLTELSADDCWALLEARRPRLGRVGFSTGDGTVVYPMNYAVADRTVFLRTQATSRLASAVDPQQVAFEVDEVDAHWETGWSVLAHGHLREVVDLDELERYRELPLRTWAPDARLHLLRLDVARISGRRLA